jgi:hypothetical protein
MGVTRIDYTVTRQKSQVTLTLLPLATKSLRYQTPLLPSGFLVGIYTVREFPWTVSPLPSVPIKRNHNLSGLRPCGERFCSAGNPEHAPPGMKGLVLPPWSFHGSNSSGFVTSKSKQQTGTFGPAKSQLNDTQTPN